MRVKDVMTAKVIRIGVDEPVLKAARLMLQNRVSGLPVIDKHDYLRQPTREPLRARERALAV